jgi:hypothetical protein
MDVGTQSWPPKIMLNKLLSFEMSRMASGGVVMESVKKIISSRGRNVGAIFVIQNGVDNLPIRQSGFHGR